MLQAEPNTFFGFLLQGVWPGLIACGKLNFMIKWFAISVASKEVHFSAVVLIIGIVKVEYLKLSPELL